MRYDKRILITGASSGIGRCACEHFLSIGYKVVGLSRNKIDIKHEKFTYLNCDITCTKSFEALKYHPISEKCIDTLLNCAGITIPSHDQQSIEDFEKTLDVNLIGSYRTIINFLPNIKKSNYGSIINVASIGGISGFNGNPAYGASKAAIINLSKSLAVDFSPLFIRVNSVSPGYFKTKMTEISYNNKKLRKIRENNTILGRFGEINELMGTFEFLSSNNSSYITGQNLVVDGGWTVKGMVQC